MAQGLEDRPLPSIDGCDVLIVRGASSADDLTGLGLPFAERFQRAKTVVLVPTRGMPCVLKRELGRVEFVDIDGRMDKLARVFDMIFEIYLAEHPGEEDRAHERVGFFLFYCHLDRGESTPTRVLDLIFTGDIDGVGKCARGFIDSGFESAMLTPA
jgi:hypothetical protein